MVGLDFGLIKSIFDESRLIGEGLGSDQQQTVVKAAADPPTAAFFAMRFNKSERDGVLIVHSATRWCNVAGGDTEYTDDGVTWTDSVGDNGKMDAATVCRGDLTKAVAWHTDSNDETWFTTDSSENWTLSNSVLPNLTYVLDIDYVTATFAVAVGKRTAGTGVYISADGCNNWAESDSGPNANTVMVSMFDTTTGYLVDTGENIWKTVNGAVDWADTGVNVNRGMQTYAEGQTMLAVSATVFLMAAGGGWIERYDNTAGTITKKAIVPSVSASGRGSLSNFVKTTNGNIYIAYIHADASAASGRTGRVVLYKSTDDGVSWSIRHLPNNVNAPTAIATKTLLSETETDNLVLWLGDGTALVAGEV